MFDRPVLHDPFTITPVQFKYYMQLNRLINKKKLTLLWSCLMTDVNNISEVPFVVAEVHTVDTFCNTYHTSIMDSNKNTQNSTYYPHPERGAKVRRMK
jgi:hypothetical protein